MTPADQVHEHGAKAFSKAISLKTLLEDLLSTFGRMLREYLN